VDKFNAHDEDSEVLDAHYSCLERKASRFEAPHGCIGGYVFIGHLLEEDGEEREIIESAPCRRCHGPEV
jgi:hypothetical protein